MIKSLNAWLLGWRSKRATRRLAEQAFRAKYPAGSPRGVEHVAEDEKSWIIQVSHGSPWCRMASFWDVSKADFAARELHASELRRFFGSASGKKHLAGNVL